MKNTQRRILTLLIPFAMAVSLAACGGSQGSESGGESGGSSSSLSQPPGTAAREAGGNALPDWFSFTSYDSKDQEVDKDLFYVNNGSLNAADPAILYVEEGENAGYFYIYGTSDQIGCRGFCAWKSKNLSDWEPVGVVFLPDFSTNWHAEDVWAPGIIYDEGKYYLFYSAAWRGEKGKCRYDSCAVSDSPEGPFLEITGDTKRADEPLMFFERHTDEIPRELVTEAVGYEGTPGAIMQMGPYPFIDPQTGRRYLFFVAGVFLPWIETGSCYCIEMEDWATPKWETLTRLTEYGKASVGGDEEIEEGQNINEGPMCYYKDGKYYLMFLTWEFSDPNYQTRLAVADQVMGPYTKLSPEEGGQVLYFEPDFQRQAVGIHGQVQLGDTLMSAYMYMGARKMRYIGVDEIVFAENSDGLPVMYCNGPSVTPQALPEKVSGYRNVAPGAAVAAKDGGNASDAGLLTDRIIPYHDNSPAGEYETDSGATLTFEWEGYKAVRAVMVYNSRQLDRMFDQVDTVTLDYRKDGKEGQLTFDPVKYNWDYYDAENEKRAVGSAAIAEFDEIEVNKITLTVSSAKNGKVAIPEVIILGKDVPD